MAAAAAAASSSSPASSSAAAAFSPATAAQVATWTARLGPVDSIQTGCLVSVGENGLQRRYSVNGYNLGPRDMMYIITHRITSAEFAHMNREMITCSLGNKQCINVADGHCVLSAHNKANKRKHYVAASTKRTEIVSETAEWDEAIFIEARDYIMHRTTQMVTGDGCWPWKLSLDKRAGTGNPIKFHGFHMLPSRLSFLAFKGQKYPNARNSLLRVGHLCTNHSCCNPNHLTNSTGPDSNAIHGYADTYSKRTKDNKDAAMLMFMSASLHDNPMPPLVQAAAAAAAAAASSSS